jgi:hypothetical protein
MDIRHKLLRIGSTRFWSRVGATLGLLATLWATLVGKTLPELLASSKPPITRFHQAANRSCSRLPQSNTSPDPTLIAGPRVNSTTRVLTSHDVFALGEQFLGKVADPASDVTRDLFAIESPPLQYASEYRLFEQDWTGTARGLYSLYLMTEDDLYSLYFVRSDLPRPVLPGSRAQDYRRSLASILERVRTVIRRAHNAEEEATIMDLYQCVGAVAWIETEAETFGERLLGEPGTPAS